MDLLADFVIIAQAPLVRSLESESAERTQWFPAPL